MRTCLVLLVACSLGCKGDDSKGASAAAKSAPPAIDAAVTFDRTTFCTEVFPTAEVAKVVATELVVGEAPTQTGARIGCLLKAAGEVDPPFATTLRIDCTSPSGTYDQRALVAQMATEDHEHEQVALGRGGAKLYQPRFQSRFLAFGHGELPCAITIETEGANTDHLDALAKLVLARLTSSNRPR